MPNITISAGYVIVELVSQCEAEFVGWQSKRGNCDSRLPLLSPHVHRYFLTNIFHDATTVRRRAPKVSQSLQQP